MSLYREVQTRLNVTNFLNDTMLFVFNYQTWDELVANNRLDAEAAGEHSTAIAYWQGKYDAAQTPDERSLIRLRMQTAFGNAYRGAERRALTETEFYEILEYDAGAV